MCVPQFLIHRCSYKYISRLNDPQLFIQDLLSGISEKLHVIHTDRSQNVQNLQRDHIRRIQAPSHATFHQHDITVFSAK